MRRSKRLSFGDVIACNRPHTQELVNERWAFLKSEHERMQSKDAIKSMAVIIIAGFVFFGIIALICILKH